MGSDTGTLLAIGGTAAGIAATGGVGASFLPFALAGPTQGIAGAVTGQMLLAGAAGVATAGAGYAQYKATSAAAKSEMLASAARARDLELSADKEKAQAAIEEQARQRRARRQEAAQRAAFAGVVDPTTGSALRIQEATASEINRQSRLASLTSDLTVSSINRQAKEELLAGYNKGTALKSKAKTSLIETVSDVGQQTSDILDLRGSE